MWGNLPGWILSALIAVVFGGAIVKFGTPESIATPSGQFANLADPIKLPVSPEEAIPGLMVDADKDAGEMYWQAIRIYEESPRIYDQFDIKHIDRVPDLKALNWIVDGASARKAKIFVGKPETLVNYRYPWPELDALYKLGQLCSSIGYYYGASPNNRNEELSKKYLNAAFSLGAKLAEERLRHSELFHGIMLMRGAADNLANLANKKNDTTTASRLKSFSDQTSSYYNVKVKPLYEKVASIGQADVGAYAGDVFEIAWKNPDRMWKVEAILKVGQYRFNATRNGDQVGANRALGDDPAKYGYPDWNKSDDPAVRAAAAIAKDLTIEKFRMIQ